MPQQVYPNGFDASYPVSTPSIQTTAYIYIYNPILSEETFGFPIVNSSNLPYINFAYVSATAILPPAIPPLPTGIASVSATTILPPGTPNLPTGTVSYNPYNPGGDQATDITDVFINPIL